ncbi:DUF5988 family protein [Micromonospora sp. WMMD987]|uniref:DUF5988 family protein n=1 Tax=Micromonospora TaxID=1873 RepID=UPI00249B10E5|nr:DUF5988 family protein [Micromonospora sp. WMMD987]WFE97561.1 DUF5988 family protein [Micromonospora sp. WMMD987]
MDSPTASTTGTVDIVLEGGPASLPVEVRRQRVDSLTDTVKICHYGGYEHFGRVDGESPVDGPVLFRWIGRTRVAE